MSESHPRTSTRRTVPHWGWLVLGVTLGCGGLARGGGTVNDGGTDRQGDASPGRQGGLSCINKVDLLFDIDNSASMGDKERYLAAAVPDLITRLVQPNCVGQPDPVTGISPVLGISNNGDCTMFAGSSTIEFPPVHDMHIGVISSSLGTRGVTGGGAVCIPTAMTESFPSHPAILAHNDDRAELLNRTAMDPYTEGSSADEGAQHFLNWFPTGSSWADNAGKTPTSGPQALSPVATPLAMSAQLEQDFQALVVGVHAYGCGIGSPIESWYRFLVQPDPYDSIVIDGMGHAQWSGVDATIIQQRHDFLRPDSLVLIVDISDKDDQEIDVRSFGGQGYKFMDANFQPPRGTSSCAGNPQSPMCTSCAYGGGVATDPNCKMGPYSNENDPGFYIGVRTVHMMQKYGIDPQFPIGRYVLGLESPKVPDRDHEYPPGANSYQGGLVGDRYDLNCTNPLYAATLPDGSVLSQEALCNTKGAGGIRPQDFVFYAHIGGVPHQFLQQNPADPNSPAKAALSPSDWVKILGQGWESAPSPAWARNPNAFDYTGIDPHMIESFSPRPGIVVDGAGPNPMGGFADPINGSDWITGTTSPEHRLPIDVEYACIFPLAMPLDCTSPDYSVQEACDCSVTGLPPDAVPPVCGLGNPGVPYASGTNDYTKQYYAKAYPTVRELQVARLMESQGIVASLCPVHIVPQGAADPLYGYRSVLTPVVNRLKCAPP